MKRNTIVKIMILATLMAMLLSSSLSCAASPVKASELSLTGYIMDTHCFQSKPEPGLDSKKCLQMPACAATGYGIAVLQADNTYAFYVFDGKFAPAPAGSQLLAFNLVNETLKTDHISISVTGTLTGGTVKADDGTEFKVINASTLSEGKS